MVFGIQFKLIVIDVDFILVRKLAHTLLSDLAHENFHKLGALQGLIGGLISKKIEPDHSPNPVSLLYFWCTVVLH